MLVQRSNRVQRSSVRVQCSSVGCMQRSSVRVQRSSVGSALTCCKACPRFFPTERKSNEEMERGLGE